MMMLASIDIMNHDAWQSSSKDINAYFQNNS